MKKTICLLLLLTIVVTMFGSCKEDSDNYPLKVPDIEERMVIDARENQEYIVDKVTIAITETLGENGSVTYMTIEELIDELYLRKQLSQEISFRVTVKFTAIEELCYASVTFNIPFVSSEGEIYGITKLFDELGQPSVNYNTKSHNISPGVHYLYFDCTIPAWDEDSSSQKVIDNLGVFDEDPLIFVFKTYRE